MITDRLKDCPFCSTPLVIQDLSGFRVLCCAQETNHNGLSLWAYYDEIRGGDLRSNRIIAVNIQHHDWQININLDHQTTRLIYIGEGDAFRDYKQDQEFNCCMDFDLTQQNIEDKIKTLLTFG